MYFLKSFTLYIYFFLSFSALGAPLVFPFGVELEYASVENHTAPASKEKVTELLTTVTDLMGDSHPEIHIEPWKKYQDATNVVMGTYLDAQNRKWVVEPENMFGAEYDGYELVPPPSKSTEDITLLESLLKKINASKKFIEGPKSSTHFTYDVSKLVTADGNCDALVNAILYIESHWPEIYVGVGPKRYGTTINEYALPAVIQHQELFEELAKLPASERTMDRVSSIFQRYEHKESRFWDYEQYKKWKFRAANYGRLFGIGNFKKNSAHLYLLEFRIPDLANEFTLRSTGTFLSRVIEKGSTVPQSSFINPFPLRGLQDRAHGKSFEDVDHWIAEQGNKNYLSFVKEIGLNQAEFPSRIRFPDIDAKAADCWTGYRKLSGKLEL